jgi:hypothetical protein
MQAFPSCIRILLKKWSSNNVVKSFVPQLPLSQISSNLSTLHFGQAGAGAERDLTPGRPRISLADSKTSAPLVDLAVRENQ